MEFKELKEPTYSYNPDYSIAFSKNPDSYRFACDNCNSLLKINYQRQINNYWAGKTEVINNTEQIELKRYYNIGLSNKSHEGGLPVFDKIECPKCFASFITYCGVNEFSNSAFSVQVQGILKVEKINQI